MYLTDTLETFVEVGVLTRVEDEADGSEPCYGLSEDSPILAAVRRFEDAVDRELGTSSAD